MSGRAYPTAVGSTIFAAYGARTGRGLTSEMGQSRRFWRAPSSMSG